MSSTASDPRCRRPPRSRAKVSLPRNTDVARAQAGRHLRPAGSRTVMVFARLRIEPADPPGARAAVTRVLAARGLNVVEVSIHESEPPRAIDEIVVHAEDPVE